MIKLFLFKEQGANSAIMLFLFLSGDIFPSSLSLDKNKMAAIVLKIHALEFACTASYKERSLLLRNHYRTSYN